MLCRMGKQQNSGEIGPKKGTLMNESPACLNHLNGTQNISEKTLQWG